jgi:hypothetical protein
VRAAPVNSAQRVVTVPMWSHGRPIEERGASPLASRPDRPTVVKVGDCGTAFLYLSRIGNDQTRAVFGFRRLTRRGVQWAARATFTNDDTDFSVTAQIHGPMFLRTHLQREMTKWTGSGEVTVYVQIAVRPWRGGMCFSDPNLFDRIFVH